MDNRTPDQRKVDEMQEQMATYGRFARPSAGTHDAAASRLMEEALEASNLTVNEDDIEVKYTPNRAARRRAAQAAKRSVRRGQRDADRKVRELSKGMTPEQVARAEELARKSLGQRRG